jgi:AraC-like DNA-binding protein
MAPRARFELAPVVVILEHGGSYSISEIARSLGYESASAFTKKPLRKLRAVRRGQKSVITISGHTEAQSLPEPAFECEST